MPGTATYKYLFGAVLFLELQADMKMNMARSVERRTEVFDFIMQQRKDISSGSTILFANLPDRLTQQINYFLLNNPDLFNFISYSPMFAFFYERKPLCTST